MTLPDSKKSFRTSREKGDEADLRHSKKLRFFSSSGSDEPSKKIESDYAVVAAAAGAVVATGAIAVAGVL